MEISTFQRHPSKLLNDLYSKKNYQGANPIDSEVIFVGRDPNWAADVETNEMFISISDYLNDGPAFWKTQNIQHPFLLPSYKGDGKTYHRNFSKLKMPTTASDRISFVELIGFPTTGMAKSNRKIFWNICFQNQIEVI